MSAPETPCIHLGHAADDMQPSPIADGVWSIYALHQPPSGPPLANRCLLYLVDGDEPELVVVNGITVDLEKNEPFAAIRRLSAELDAPVRNIFNPGPEHHLSLAAYATAFPEARVWVASGRIERENPDLCALPNVGVLPVGDVLPELARGGFCVHVWDGLMVGRIGNVVQGRLFKKRGTAEPVLFHHKKSRTLLNGGHGWWVWGDDTFLPWVARKLFRMRRGDVVWSPFHYLVFDRDRCASSAARVLHWEVDELLDLHAPLNDWMRAGVGDALRRLCQPMVDGKWEQLPLADGVLGIAEQRPSS